MGAKKNNAAKKKVSVKTLTDHELGQIAKGVADGLAERPAFKNDVAWYLVRRLTISIVLSAVAIFTIVVAVQTWVVSKVQSHIDRTDVAVSNQLFTAQTNLGSRILQVDASIRTNISTRFAESNVQATLSEVVAAEAESLFGKKIQPAITVFSNTVIAEISNVAALVSQSQTTVRDSTNTLALLQLVGTALTMDVDAYERLADFEMSTNASLNDIAWRARRTVELQAMLMRIAPKGLDISSVTNWLDTEHASVSAYTNIYKVTAGVLEKCAILTCFVNQTPSRFTKLEVLDFLYSVVATERNILVLEHASKLAEKLGGMGYNFRFRGDAAKWYRDSRTKFQPSGSQTNNPP